MVKRPLRQSRIRVAALWLAAAILLQSCAAGGAPAAFRSPTPVLHLANAPVTPTPFQPLPPTDLSGALVSTLPPTQVSSPVPTTDPATSASEPAASPIPTEPSSAANLWVSPALPAAFQEALVLPAGMGKAAQAEGVAVRLEVETAQTTGGVPASLWVYALVAPFPTIEDGVSFRALQRCWQGEAAGPFGGRPLLVDQSTYEVFSARWGAPAAGAVEVIEPGKLLNRAWNYRPAWAIVPFERLGPRWKVLEVDGQSPVRKDFDPAAYPLSVPFTLSGNPGLVEALRPGIPASNRDPGKLTTVVLTGVTALVRATAWVMERNGIRTPAEYVGEWLRQADIAHISNEVPFAENCPYPNPQQEGLRFCSSPRYIELLEEVGTDVVELTGDHFADWGPEAMLYTLDLYRQRGWPYYGGGENIEEGRKAVTFEHNGNRIAFIGCNGKGGGYATARENNPGAVACDYDWMHAEIARLKVKGFLVIATFQHVEVYASMVPEYMRGDFTGMAEAGAVIVSGSQAHQPHGMEFVGNSFVHFGLGNLFFDQYRFFAGPDTDRAFLDRHVFYGGRYISTELLPIYFISLSHGRPMTPEEKTIFLEGIFGASGW